MAKFTLDPAHDRSLAHLLFDIRDGALVWRVTRGPKAAAGSIAGCLNSNGYRSVCVGGVNHRAHRIVWLMQTGVWPTHEIDHVNGNRDDNRIENLRDVPRSANAKNRMTWARSRSGISGVRYDKGTGKWMVRLCFDRKEHYFGLYADLDEAVAVRNAEAKRLGYHDNHGRRHVAKAFG